MKVQKTGQGMAVLIAALSLVVGLVPAGCDNGLTGDDKPQLQDIVVDAAVTGPDGQQSTANGKVFLVLNENQDRPDYIEAGTITNGTLSLKFPATLAAKYLYTISNSLPTGINISSPDRKGVSSGRLVYGPGTGNLVGALSCQKTVDAATIYTMYMYVDGETTIDGNYSSQTHSITYSSLSLSKGWNTVYQTESTANNVENITFSTTGPSGLEWIISPLPHDH